MILTFWDAYNVTLHFPSQRPLPLVGMCCRAKTVAARRPIPGWLSSLPCGNMCHYRKRRSCIWVTSIPLIAVQETMYSLLCAYSEWIALLYARAVISVGLPPVSLSARWLLKSSVDHSARVLSLYASRRICLSKNFKD